MCEYKLLIIDQDLAQKGLAQANILLKAFLGYFLTHPVYINL